jgi:hypothetical protein
MVDGGGGERDRGVNEKGKVEVVDNSWESDNVKSLRRLSKPSLYDNAYCRIQAHVRTHHRLNQ